MTHLIVFIIIIDILLTLLLINFHFDITFRAFRKLFFGEAQSDSWPLEIFLISLKIWHFVRRLLLFGILHLKLLHLNNLSSIIWMNNLFVACCCLYFWNCSLIMIWLYLLRQRILNLLIILGILIFIISCMEYRLWRIHFFIVVLIAFFVLIKMKLSRLNIKSTFFAHMIVNSHFIFCLILTIFILRIQLPLLNSLRSY